MVKFFKSGIEFNNMAKAMNGMNLMIQDLVFKMDHGGKESESIMEIFVLAYTSRKGVMDRIQANNWTLETKIIVPTINRSSIPLSYAISQTIDKVITLAANLDISEEVEEILLKGPAFYEFEKNIPDHLRRNI